MDNFLYHTQDFILNRFRNDTTTFYGHADEYTTVRNLVNSTVLHAESNSALIIGPPRSGKTTLLNSVLFHLDVSSTLIENTIIVRLDGLIDSDDSIALKSATTQMQLDNIVEGRVFGSYAENLTFLLTCLRSGDKTASKRVIFILDHLDLFCAHSKQTLLYNLFDIVQSAQTPLCVIGLTCRIDVLELFEKRVKSRFSHRKIVLYPGSGKFNDQIEIFEDLLSLPLKSEFKQNSTKHKNNNSNVIQFNNYPIRYFQMKNYINCFDDQWTNQWNKNVKHFFVNTRVRGCLESIYDFDTNPEILKQIFGQLISKLMISKTPVAGVTVPFIEVEDLVKLCGQLDLDEKLQLYFDISVLEVCLLISIKHHSEIYDRDPFNFEMILTRYRKFENSSQTRMENVDRAVALKSFEHLNMLEIFVPVNSTAAKVQKEFQMHKLTLTNNQIKHLITQYPNLPTDLSQWAATSLV